MKTWIAFMNILMKDMRSYYLKPPNISWGLLFPVAWTLMFFLRSPVALNIRELLPGVISLSILFGTTSMLAVTITFERRSRSFERLLLAPISLNLLMLAKTLGAILFGVINAFVPVIFASFMTTLSGINWLILLSSIILIAITSTFLGLFIAVSVSQAFEAQTFSNFFRFPMLFLCGLFIPIQEMPVVIRPLSYILPLTYGVDNLKTAVNNNGYLAVPFNFLLLFIFSVLLFSYSMSNVNKKWLS
ncbi:MAG: ABC transporter permease [Dethiobacteria bacterium]|jgi:ABC-2 type transport system permease protein